MVDQLPDVRVTLKLPQDFHLAPQTDFGRILNHTSFVCRRTVYVIGECRFQMWEHVTISTWRSKLSREASARQHTRLSRPSPPDQSAKAKPWRPLRNLSHTPGKDKEVMSRRGGKKISLLTIQEMAPPKYASIKQGPIFATSHMRRTCARQMTRAMEHLEDVRKGIQVLRFADFRSFALYEERGRMKQWLILQVERCVLYRKTSQSKGTSRLGSDATSSP